MVIIWACSQAGVGIGGLAFAYSAPQTIGLIVLSWVVFTRWHESLSPKGVQTIRTRWAEMVPFVSVTALPLVVVGIQPTVIALTSGAGAAGAFALYWRPVSAVAILLLGAVTPIWVAASSRSWGRREVLVTYSLLSGVAFAGSACAAAGVTAFTGGGASWTAIMCVVVRALLAVASLGGAFLAANDRAVAFARMFVGLVCWQAVWAALARDATAPATLLALAVPLLLIAVATTAAELRALER